MVKFDKGKDVLTQQKKNPSDLWVLMLGLCHDSKQTANLF